MHPSRSRMKGLPPLEDRRRRDTIRSVGGENRVQVVGNLVVGDFRVPGSAEDVEAIHQAQEGLAKQGAPLGILIILGDSLGFPSPATLRSSQRRMGRSKAKFIAVVVSGEVLWMVASRALLKPLLRIMGDGNSFGFFSSVPSATAALAERLGEGTPSCDEIEKALPGTDCARTQH